MFPGFMQKNHTKMSVPAESAQREKQKPPKGCGKGRGGLFLSFEMVVLTGVIISGGEKNKLTGTKKWREFTRAIGQFRISGQDT